MQTYWDLSEKERAELSREDVDNFAAAELMTKGVLRVKQPELEHVPQVHVPNLTLYRVRANRGYTTMDPCFPTPEAARAFLDLKPLEFCQGYVGGGTVQFAQSIEDPEIVEVQLYSKPLFDSLKGDLERSKAIEIANERRQRQYDEALKTQDEALKGMWEDWATCRDRRTELLRVVETFDEYVKIAGDNRVATKFLLKIFEQKTIAEAAQWFQRPIDVYAAETEAA